MKLTRELIFLCSNNGGWNYAQLKLLGVKLPPEHGWLSDLIGKEIPDEDWNKIMALSGTRKKQRKEILQGQEKLL